MYLKPSLQALFQELEALGEENDRHQQLRSEKLLNITRDTGEFLNVLVRASKSKRILEISTSNGYSTLWFASSIPDDGKVTTVECNDSKIHRALENFNRAGLLHKIEILKGDAAETVADLSGEYDLIFLDVERSQYESMITSLLRVLKPDGLIVCDNALSHRPELEGFIRYFDNNPCYAASLVPVGKGEYVIHRLKTE